MKTLQVIALEGNRGFPTNNEVNPWTLTLGPLPLSLSDALHVLARNRNTWHVGQKESTETAPRSLKICSLEAVLETTCLSEGAVLLCTLWTRPDADSGLPCLPLEAEDCWWACAIMPGFQRSATEPLGLQWPGAHKAHNSSRKKGVQWSLSAASRCLLSALPILNLHGKAKDQGHWTRSHGKTGSRLHSG